MSEEENAALVVKEGMKQIFAPYHDLISKLLGPAATEVGLSWGDSVKVWRLERQLRLLKEVKRMLDVTSGEIKPIAPRLFFPVFEAASIEDDDEMQTRWAALLANEATSFESVHPSFVEILKQLAPADAQLLDKIFDWCESRHTRTIEWWMVTPLSQRQQRDEEALANLVRLGLVVSDYNLVAGQKQLKFVGGQAEVLATPKLKEDSQLCDVAIRFVKACRAPVGSGA
jgi:hypothetical protein